MFKSESYSLSGYGSLKSTNGNFFLLCHRNNGKKRGIAFPNADWRDFESTPASKERPDNSITIFDYHRLLTGAGWEITHRIECPLSTERLNGNMVSKMQERRILGTVGRTLLIAKRHNKIM